LSETLIIGNNTGGNDIITDVGDVILSVSGGTLLDLRSGGVDGFTLLGQPSSTYGGKGGFGDGGGILFLSSDGVTLAHDGGDFNDFYLYTEKNNYGQLARFRESDNTYYGFNIYGNNTYQNFSTGVSIKDNGTNSFTTTNKDNPAIIIGSRNSTISSGVTNSVIIGGSGITANQNNTVYVPNLNIFNLPTNNNSATQILSRNSTTGVVEYRDVSTLGGGSSVLITGGTWSEGNILFTNSTGGTFTVLGSNQYGTGAISGSSGWSQSFNGTITLPTIKAALYDNPNHIEPLRVYEIIGGVSGTDFPALDNNATNYIVIKYNSGNPVYDILSDDSTINDSDVVRFMTVYRLNNFIHTLEFGNQGAGKSDKINNRIVATERFKRENGFALSLNSSTGVASLSSGIAWNGIFRQSLDGVNSQDDIFFQNYKVGGNWVTAVTADTINNTFYNDGTNPVAGTPGKFLVNYYFRGQEVNDHLYELWGSDEYDTIAEAQISPEPPLPELISSHAFLVGRIIIPVGQFSGGTVESSFVTVFQAGAVTRHNDLTDIQGGQAGQYFHLTSNQYNNLALTNTDNQFSVTQTINGGLVVTGETTTGTLKVLTVPSGSTSNQVLVYNTSNGQVERKTDSGSGSNQSKAISVPEPTATDDITLFFTDAALTISSVVVVLRGTSPSITFSLSSGGDRTTVTTNNVNGQTVTNTTTGTSVTIANTAVSANNFIWLRITAVSGTVTEAHFTINYIA
jgi:hypothetical protein